MEEIKAFLLGMVFGGSVGLVVAALALSAGKGENYDE